MTVPADLLAQAQHLLTRDRNRPQQANLRRSISTAYYALFHLLGEAAAARICAGQSNALTQQARRALTHTDMANAAKGLRGTTLPKAYRLHMPGPVPNDLLVVAAAFSDLQQARHAADYDFSKNITRSEARTLVDRAHDAFASWSRVRHAPEAKVFLTMLYLWKSLQGR